MYVFDIEYWHYYIINIYLFYMCVHMCDCM